MDTGHIIPAESGYKVCWYDPNKESLECEPMVAWWVMVLSTVEDGLSVELVPISYRLGLVTDTRYTCVVQPDGTIIPFEGEPTTDVYEVLEQFRARWDSESEENKGDQLKNEEVK